MMIEEIKELKERLASQAFTIARLEKLTKEQGSQLDDAWRELAHMRPARSFMSLPSAIKKEMNLHYPVVSPMAIAKELNMDSDRIHCAYRGLGGSIAPLQQAFKDQSEVYHRLHEFVQDRDALYPTPVSRYTIFLNMVPSLTYGNLDIYQCEWKDLAYAVKSRAQSISKGIEIIVRECP